MRQIYLIRHGKPNIPFGTRMCLGSADLELGTAGHLQACLLAENFKDVSISSVFCSRLTRSRETAGYFTEDPIVLPGLEESFFGDWDGLTFDEIQNRWPELYEARGKDRSILPNGTEPDQEALLRFKNAVQHALTLSTGDIAIVAHRNVNQLLIADILGDKNHYQYDLDYCSVTTLFYHEETQEFTIKEIGKAYHPDLTEDLCEMLLDAARVPDNIKRHCKAVAQKAMELCDALEANGHYYNRRNMLSATLLHDIARLEKQHAKVGEAWLRALGYPEVAELIGQHHDLNDIEKLDEAAIVHMADRCVQEDRVVTLEERFQKNKTKCKDIEAQEAFQKRYEDAFYLKDKINHICGKEVIL